MDARLIAAAIPFFFALIGLERWLTRRRADPYYRLHDSLADLSCGIGQQVVQIFVLALITGSYVLVWDRWRLMTVSETSVAGWIALLVLVDVAFYWFHRASHRVNFLWAIHAVHHQSEEYNLSVALRQAWLEPLAIAAFHLPIALCGFPPAMFLAAYTINTLYQFWVHTRGIGKLGPVELALNTPSHHRVHHAINPAYIDKNYSGMFIVWDRLFGTFTAETEEPVYGTVKPLHSFNPAWAQVAYWLEIARLAARAPRLVDKLRAWIAPPEWRPPELGGPVTIPPVTRAAQQKYDVRAPRAVNRYVVASFVLVILSTSAIILAQEHAPLLDLAVSAALIMATLATIAGLVEGRRWAVPLEIARLVALVPAAALLAHGTPHLVPAIAAAALVSAIFAAGLWRARPAIRDAR